VVWALPAPGSGAARKESDNFAGRLPVMYQPPNAQRRRHQGRKFSTVHKGRPSNRFSKCLAERAAASRFFVCSIMFSPSRARASEDLYRDLRVSLGRRARKAGSEATAVFFGACFKRHLRSASPVAQSVVKTATRRDSVIAIELHSRRARRLFFCISRTGRWAPFCPTRVQRRNPCRPRP